MKRTFFFCLIIFIAQNIYANSIDSLKTDNDVVQFLKRINEDFRSTKFKPIELRSTETLRKELDCGGIADKWQVNNWEKVDFNNDGRTDLLVQLYWYDYGVYVVTDNGNGSFKLHTLSYNIYEKCELAKPYKSSDGQFLLFFEGKQMKDRNGNNTRIVSQIDTMVYQYGGFVENNRMSSNYSIDSITFHTSACYGSCPVFSITMDKNGNAIYDAQVYNPKQGKFSAAIDRQNMENITGLINYISVKNLKNDYKVDWTDDQTSWLDVKFSDGSVKTIRDYGLRGTAGLRLLYSFFFDLRSNQNWK